MGRNEGSRGARVAALAVFLATVPGMAAAQRFDADFLFGAPQATLSVRAGLAFASAGSDIFTDSQELFTLERGDFHGMALGADLGVRIAPRLDFVAGIGVAHASAGSEYRDWEGEDNRPIEQRTSFTRLPVTGGVKAYVTPRGREIGRFVWIPARAALYATGGGGLVWYRFAQSGEFVDIESLDIVQDELSSSGFAPTVYAGVGGEFTVSKRFALAVEGRYSWGSAKLDPFAFDSFEPIDLGGLSTTVGFLVRF